MQHDLKYTRFAVKAFSATGKRPRELDRTMAPHPLSFQELPFDPEYTLYNSRLTPQSLNNITDDEMYWAVRTGVILRHTGELPIEISGPDAETLLNRVFTRDVSKVKPGRCSYQIACYHDGGMITDGVLLRLSKDRFWMAQADGDLFSWYKAHAKGLDVTVRDPNVWVSQIQGPKSLDVLRAAIDGGDENYPASFNYFDYSEVNMVGQKVVISRSGFTNELGWEIYIPPETNHKVLGDHLMKVGEPFGMLLTATPVFRARRIEAGLLNAGSDFDETTTPYDAGLGAFVDLNKDDFVGRDTLLNANKESRTWGMQVEDGIAVLGRAISINNEIVGHVCSSTWSPFLKCGIAIVRMDSADHGPETKVSVEGIDDKQYSATICTLPMYDENREIPRGILVDIPEYTTTE